MAQRQANSPNDNSNHSNAYKTFGWDEEFTCTPVDLHARYRVDFNIVRRAFDSLSAVLKRKTQSDDKKISATIMKRILNLQLQLLDMYGFHIFSFNFATLDLLLRVLSSQSITYSEPSSIAAIAFISKG